MCCRGPVPLLHQAAPGAAMAALEAEEEWKEGQYEDEKEEEDEIFTMRRLDGPCMAGSAPPP